MNEEGNEFRVLVADGHRDVKLSMQSLWLTGQVLPVGARLTAVHSFRSAEEHPTEVVYAFGLPRDAALRQFKIVGDGFTVKSELRPVDQAREAYEAGIQGGHLSALSRVYRDGRVNLSLGNIRPDELVRVFLEIVAGVNLRDDGYRFRFPFTLAPCYHALMRAVGVTGGMEMELPSGEFGDVILPPWMNSEEKLHRVGFDLSVSWPGGAKGVGSPSHRVQVTGGESGLCRLASAQGGDVPNRDLVVDVKGECHGAHGYGGRGETGEGVERKERAFAVAIPSHCFGEGGLGPRNMVFLLDRSGSMDGLPLEQAKQALLACVGALDAEDRFNIMVFDNVAESFATGLVPASDRHRNRARAFLNGVRARGGTELGSALREALIQAGGERADVFVLTDGQVAATEDIIERTRERGVRVHALGIGSASQDRFLAMLAEATGGVSEFVMPRERVDIKALELFSSAGRRLAEAVEGVVERVQGWRWVVAPKNEVFAGFPLVLWGKGCADETFTLRLRWRVDGERRERAWTCASTAHAETVRLLQGARLITAAEARCGTEPDGSWRKHKREAARWLKKLEELGHQYGLANRALSLVAVLERRGDDASQVPVTRVVPVGMPEDLAADAYVGRVGQVCGLTADPAATLGASLSARSVRRTGLFGLRKREAQGPVYGYERRFSSARVFSASESSGPTDLDELMALMGELQSDGGLPGSTLGDRILRTAATVILLQAKEREGITSLARAWMERMIRFLHDKSLEMEELGARETVELLLGRVERAELVEESGMAAMRGIALGQAAAVSDGWNVLGRWLRAKATP